MSGDGRPPAPPPVAPPGLQVDPITGQQVVLVGRRQDRPNRPATGCPFCPGGLEAPDAYDVRSFVNRWPALPDGRAEVVLYAPDHDVSLSGLGAEGVRKVVDLWVARTKELATRDDVAYVLIFENRGVEVGATIAHPHGQIYAFDAVPPAVEQELALASAAGPCALCRDADVGERAVTEVGEWQAWVPLAPSWPYELVLAPRSHHPDLAAATAVGADADALAALLVDVFARLDRLFSAPMPLMWWWHQAPCDGRARLPMHLHAHVAPLLRAPGTARYVAAGELGSGVHFNPVVPEDAAEALRRA